MRNQSLKALLLLTATFLLVAIWSTLGSAGSLREGSGSTGSSVNGPLPGEVQWTYFQTFNSVGQFCPPGPGPEQFEDVLCNNEGEGDNILRLINPNGGANGNLSGIKTQTVCAMIYVFDDDEEMGECCGCPLSSAQLATFSINQNLTANFGIPGEPGVSSLSSENALGAIAVVAAAPNVPIVLGSGSNGNACGASQSGACNLGCDPTNTPGYVVSPAANLFGSMTHEQSVQQGAEDNQNLIFANLTETALSDDGGGDPTNVTYLQAQCGVLVGNGTGGAICTCPLE
jgi:hypothetical protein